MKLAVIGSRGFRDFEDLDTILDEFLADDTDLMIVSGGAQGADDGAYMWAVKNEVPILIIKAEWDKHGKAAGYIRNAEIWKHCDAGIAFWDGESKGTAHSFKLAKKANKKLVIINYMTGNIHENE